MLANGCFEKFAANRGLQKILSIYFMVDSGAPTEHTLDCFIPNKPPKGALPTTGFFGNATIFPAHFPKTVIWVLNPYLHSEPGKLLSFTLYLGYFALSGSSPWQCGHSMLQGS